MEPELGCPVENVWPPLLPDSECPIVEDSGDEWMLPDTAEAPSIDVDGQCPVLVIPTPMVEFELTIALCGSALDSSPRPPEPDNDLDRLELKIGCEVGETELMSLVSP